METGCSFLSFLRFVIWLRGFRFCFEVLHDLVVKFVEGYCGSVM